ncbi:unnamed protein product [Toxocara canis]|uniref:Movement protein n=1 Tax=Toxocara canis TaxID=6265 RepID=A0A183VGZ4_TOXCA|nr:unnamed protein product [Toxocara canis]
MQEEGEILILSQRKNPGVGVSNTLQGVWRNRVSTTIIIPSELSDGSSSIISTPRKSPLWSDIAAGILNSQSLSPAYPNDATLSPYVSASVPGKKGIDVAQQQSPLRWPKSTGDGDGLLHTEDLMASRKLSGTMARGRRRPIPIILPRRKFSSSFRRETLSTDVEETQAPINTRVALTGDVLLKEISEYSTGAFASLPNVKVS